MAYNPQLHTDTNKSYGMAQAGSTDARSYYFDGTAYRPYATQTEVNNYLTDINTRKGHFPIYIAAASQPATEWWYQYPYDNASLVPKAGGAATETGAGTVELATDAEMQLTAAITEDARVSSRLKIFNWWTWVLTTIWTVTGQWIFKLIKFTNPATAGIAPGHFWFDGTNFRVYKTSADYIITKDANSSLAGATSERLVSATAATGGLLATYEVAEEINTDGAVIDACAAASYANTEHSASITIPPVAGQPPKHIYKGQKCRKAGQPYIYMAFLDDFVVRIPTG